MTANNKKHAANNKNNQRTNTLTTAVRVPLRIQSIEPDWNQPNSPPTLQHLQFGIQTFHVHFAGPSQGRQLLSLCWSSAGRKGVWRRSGHHGGWIEVNFQSSNEILCKILKKRCTWVQADEFRALFVGGFPFTHLQLSSKVGWRYYKIIHLLVEHMCVCVCVCARYSFPFHIRPPPKNGPKKIWHWISPHPPSLSSRTPVASSVVSPQNASDPEQAKKDLMASLIGDLPMWILLDKTC